MSSELLAKVIKNLENTRKQLLKSSDTQIRGKEEKQYIRELSEGWFKDCRPNLLKIVDSVFLSKLDVSFTFLLEKSTKNPSRQLVLDALKSTKNELNILSANPTVVTGITSDIQGLPDFSKIISDTRVQGLLKDRWIECSICVKNNAPIASIVMIGGLLESILLAKINSYQDKSLIFTALSSPKDITGKTKFLKDWSLYNMIEVGFELKWITISMRDFSMILRDYRNYIHPYKELSSDGSFSSKDLSLIWDFARRIVLEIV